MTKQLDIASIQHYLRFNHRSIVNYISNTSEKSWQKQSERSVLSLFYEASQRVPAYKDFLKKQHIHPDTIHSLKDYENIPPTDKKNYLDQYTLKDLVWDGTLDRNYVMNTSSGTTGKPYFWPCSTREYLEGAVLHKYIYDSIFRIGEPALLVDCFGMGTWVAGMYTFLSSYFAAEKHCPLNCITPGFNKEEVLTILNELGPRYNKIILAGYPTFIKDILDEYCKTGPIQKNKFLFLFAGEGFTESWRSYILDIANCDNPLSGAVSILGSADTAMMAFETPFSIWLRRSTSGNEKITQELFGQTRTPAILQYIPTYRYFEVVDQELLITANRSIPLIRYNIHDTGGIIWPSEIKKKYDIRGFDEIESQSQTTHASLPLVYVFGRSNFSATIYAANIYPENVREVLVDRSIHKQITGNFKLLTKYTNKQDHYLELHVELNQQMAMDAKLKQQIATLFVHHVTRQNSEYKKIHSEYGNKVKPKVVLHMYGDKEYFPKDKLKKSS